jgi:hypothetical protein
VACNQRQLQLKSIPFSFLLRGRRDYDEASNDTNADAFTADKRPVGA